MANYNKKISDSVIRIGEVRFCYAHVFSPRTGDDGAPGKYGVQILVPKDNEQAVKLIRDAIESAKERGKTTRWGGKIPPASKLRLPLRDGDEEYPDDDTYAGQWFFNANSVSAPGVRVLENGLMSEALDQDDFYSGCYGCATVSIYPYESNGNMGVGASLNNVIKIRDGERFSGITSAEDDFADLCEADAACLD